MNGFDAQRINTKHNDSGQYRTLKTISLYETDTNVDVFHSGGVRIVCDVTRGCLRNDRPRLVLQRNDADDENIIE